MQLDKLIYDVLTILEMSKITATSRHEQEYIEKKIADYRALFIQEEYYKTQTINPLWIQSYGKFDFINVNSADEEIGIDTSICFGKKDLPPVVALPNNLGYYYLSLPAKQQKIYLITRDMLMQMISIGDDRLQSFQYGVIEHRSLLVYPYIASGNASLIAENPRDCYVFRTEKVLSGSIATGISYTVYGAQILYNGATYNIGDTFTGVATITTFTGNGYLKFTTLKDSFRYSDHYPMDAAMATKVIVKLLTTDFQIEGKMIADLIQDGQDQLSYLKTYGNTQVQ